MRNAMRAFGWTAALSLSVSVVPGVTPAFADDSKEKVPASAASTEKDVPSYDLFDAMKQGLVNVSAEGIGDGRMSLSVQNKTKGNLRVVLPPGLIASGASGQFGGMGGGMGGMGGGGMGGGGMGGMGGGGMGGMGGMGGGGMGGMGGGGMGGGGMGGMGGGMGGGGMMTMPASMGMMTLARLIMNLVGDKDSWDPTSLSAGMMGGMGGMGGGGMGGMGGMGGGGMGGMGGGFRSIPPTGEPTALLKPNQTRHLPTRLASLSGPNGFDGNVGVAMPAKGEKLRIGDIRDQNVDKRAVLALTRLAKDKAPDTVATLVMWNVGGMNWDQVARKSQGFANAHEMALAKSFVEQLGDLPKDDTGAIFYEVTAKGDGANAQALAKELATVLKGHTVLGLKAQAGVPDAPSGPAVTCTIVVGGTDAQPEASVMVGTSDADASKWVKTGKFELPVSIVGGKPEAAKFADALAEGLLGRLVRAQVSKAGVVKGKTLYKVRIDNASPLILNGLAILGNGQGKSEETPKVLTGISVSPRKSMTVPATAETVDQLGLRKGVRVIAADLSGL